MSSKALTAARLGAYVVILICACGLSLYYLYSSDASTLTTMYRWEERSRVNVISKAVASDLRLLSYNVMQLSIHQEIRRFLQTGDEKYRRQVQNIFRNFSDMSPDYDQIRLLDLSGQEQVRVNMEDGAPHVVPRDQLQDKSDRYYFHEAKRLQPGEIYISPLDLNVERGKIESPFKPMLRLASGIFDEKRDMTGILLLNYLARNMLDSISLQAGVASSRTYLLNEDGYWLLSPDKEDEWTFMFPQLADHSLASMYPKAWALISRSEAGQFLTRHGLFTYSTIHTGENSQNMSNSRTERSWTLLSFTPTPMLEQLTASAKSKYLTIFLGAVALIILSALLRVRAVFMRQRAEAARETARAEAEKANNAKSDFLAHMSHEIRTPMNAVLGLTHLTKRTKTTPKQQDYLNKIELSAKNLLTIINDILDFSKIEAGEMELDSVKFSLDDVLTNVVGVLGLQAEEKGLEFVLMVDSSAPNLLLGDSQRLTQVLVNLLSNAIKFTEQGEVVLSVEEVEEKDGISHLRFSVRDTGIGMTAKQVKRLFTPFRQGDASIGRRYGGTGLGLTISRRFVELMGGRITVSSSPGKGTEFSFVLPLPLHHEHDGLHLLPPSDLRRTKVLVVESSPLTRQTITTILDSFTLRVTAVENGSQALEELLGASLTDPFRLVIIDPPLPDMELIDLIRAIREQTQGRTTPRLMVMQSFGREAELNKRLIAQVEGVLLKPFSRSMLFDTITDTMLDQHHAEDGDFAQKDPERRVLQARVLIVEDNEINRQIASEMLQELVSEVALAHNGIQAVSMVQKDSFDLIFMDIQMPGMDGFEATRRIRELTDDARVPIIAMTAHALSGDYQKSLEAGMDAHLTKPIDPEELRNTVSQYLGTREECKVALCNSAKPAEKETFFISGVDTGQALARLGGKRERLVTLLHALISESLSACEEILTALNEGDRDKAAALAHTIKGTSANLGATEISHEVELLEQNIHNEEAPLEHVAYVVAAVKRLESALPRPSRPSLEKQGTEEDSSHMSAQDALEKLRQLISRRDASSRAFMESESAAFAQLDRTLVQTLHHNLETYDFAKAADTLSELEKTMEGGA